MINESIERLDKQIKDEIKREKKFNAHRIKFLRWLESNAGDFRLHNENS